MCNNKILYRLSACALIGMLCSCNSRVSEGGHPSDETVQSQVTISETDTVADTSTNVVTENKVEITTEDGKRQVLLSCRIRKRIMISRRNLFMKNSFLRI